VVITDPRVGERVASVAASLEFDRVVGQVLNAYESARER